MKQVSLMFASMGNGITIADRFREQHGDFRKVGHISDQGIVDIRPFYDKILTPEDWELIELQKDLHLIDVEYGLSGMGTSQVAARQEQWTGEKLQSYVDKRKRLLDKIDSIPNV